MYEGIKKFVRIGMGATLLVISGHAVANAPPEISVPQNNATVPCEFYMYGFGGDDIVLCTATERPPGVHVVNGFNIGALDGYDWVNDFTWTASLLPGRSYDVECSDGINPPVSIRVTTPSVCSP